ncbi:hypothetical protein [Streptomyces nogalater]|uniref:Integral membrane protein n=1 Tax=Streptomyces nogalater TaxID=38314 RepID=A0ABW0W927_STRNO
MQGHGYGQPVTQPPHTAWLVFLRVLFVALGILTIGFLSWAMLLRLALVTRRSLDWGLFVAVLAADVLGFTLLGTEPGDEVHTTGGYVGLFLVLGTLVGAIAYYLAADIQHFVLRRQAYAVVPGGPAYGYPAPAAPYGVTTVPTAPTGPTAPAPAPHTPVPAPMPAPGPPPVAPPPQPPAPARIEQVRAELDELSDYLRRQDGHEGGR